MRALRDLRAGYAVFVAAAVAVFVASVVPPPAAVSGPAAGPIGVPLDKWVHAGTYAVLAVLLCFAARARRTRSVFLLAAAVTVYGLTIEFVQGPLPDRAFDLVDAAANAAGTVLAALAWWVAVALRTHRGG